VLQQFWINSSGGRGVEQRRPYGQKTQTAENLVSSRILNGCDPQK